MQLLDAINAVFYFYVLLFFITLITLFIGIRMTYIAWTQKSSIMMRRAKFVLLFSVIAMLCIAIVSLFETGKFPID